MSDTEHPTLRVVRGTPDDAELAAVVAVLLALPAGHGDGAPPADDAGAPVGAWADPSVAVRSTPPSGPGAWAASGREPGVRTRAAL